MKPLSQFEKMRNNQANLQKCRALACAEAMRQKEEMLRNAQAAVHERMMRGMRATNGPAHGYGYFG